MEITKTKKTKKGGFTLVETLVAISIFTVSLLAVISVLAQGITSTNYVKSKLTATYLAQEGIEYIRNMRDTSMLYDGTSAQHGWDTFNQLLANANCDESNGCYFNSENLDYGDNSQPILDLDLTACNSSPGCPKLSYDSVTGKYGYDATGQTTSFARKISIQIISDDEIKVFSTVAWSQGTGNYTEVFSESLFNWIE